MRLTNSSGGVTSKVETDPLGTQVSDSSAFNQNGGGNGYGFNPNGFYGDPTMPNMGCSEDGFEADCNKVQHDLRDGVSAQCPNNDCGPRAGTNAANGRVELFQFNANAAAAGIGTGGVGLGFLPTNVNFVGNGFTIAPGTNAVFSGMGTTYPAPGFAAGGPTAFYSLNQIEILRPWSSSAAVLPQNSDKPHQTFTLEQRLTANIAGNMAITPLIERPECRKYVTGRNMTAKQAVNIFLNVVNSMTYDPTLLDFAETDEDFGRVRLGYTFFHPWEAELSVLDLLEQVGGVKDTSALITAVSQQAYIELHEFKHKATRKKHVGAKELGEWYKGLYDNCFKEK